MSETKTDAFEEFAASLAATEEAFKKTASDEPPIPHPTENIRVKIDAYVEFLEWEKKRKAAEAAYIKARKAAFSAPINNLAAEVVTRIGSASADTRVVAGIQHAISITPKGVVKFDQEKLRRLDIGYALGSPSIDVLPGLQPKYTVDIDAVPPTLRPQVEEAVSSVTIKPMIDAIKDGARNTSGIIGSVITPDEC